MNAFEWTEARTVEQAIAQLTDGKVKMGGTGATVGGGVALKAGGVDLLDLLKENLAAPRRVVSIRNIRELDHIEFDEKGALRLGPLATLSTIAGHEQVRKQFPALATAAQRIATPQIRNMATVGGNLLQRPRCWYFRSEEFNCRKKGGDRCFAQDGQNQYHAIFSNDRCAIVHPSGMAVPLVALGATIELTGLGGKRQMPLEQFFTLPEQNVARENSLAPDELLTEITVPAPPAGSSNAYIKQGEKESFDWPIADVAVVIERDGQTCRAASIVLGAAAPIPWRAKAAEAVLKGKPLDEQTIAAAGRAAVEGANPFRLNEYKLAVFQAIVRRTIQAAIA
jgi:xanthine dehydrogenase YagS FAD-binding subunit